MNKEIAMVIESSRDFESCNIDDESSKLTKINIPRETNEFMNILQIDKGNVQLEDDEIVSIWDSFSQLDLEKLRDSVILEISDESNSSYSKSSKDEIPNQFLLVSDTHQLQERVRRSQLNSCLYQSNISEKHWKETPSEEILSRIMRTKLEASHQ